MTPHDYAPLGERDARLFAADCAEHVLPYFEAEYPGDTRPRDAVAVLRRYAVGDATEDELAAARDAARDAWAAARATVRAARAAAGDAAWAAAWAAAWEVERDWQAARLNHYLTGETT